MRAAVVAAAVSLAAPAAAGDLSLGLPIDCDLGQTCHIQHLVDRDSSPAAVDFRCGGLTYDGHKGTDFAVPSLSDMRSGVNVVAAAPGVVAALRDGMPDVPYDPADTNQVDGRECGNGVVLRHEGGWETQYCHLKSGSVAVRKGDRIVQGDVVGQVGLSGKTTFPHVHFSVRRDGVVIDPFEVSADRAPCGGGGPSMWLETPDYAPGGLVAVGFAEAIPDYGAVKNGTAARDDLPADAAALVLFAYAFGGQAADEIRLHIAGPAGSILTQAVTLDRDQPQFFRAAGKRRTVPAWPAGIYTGTARFLRDGTELAMREVQITID